MYKSWVLRLNFGIIRNRVIVLRRTFSLLAIAFLLASGLTGRAGDLYTVYVEDGKKGLVNQFGDVIIPAKYEDLGWSKGFPLFSNNVIGYKKKGKWGLITSENKVVTPPRYHSLVPSNNYIIASVKPKINSDVKFGVINQKGKLIIPFTYSELKIAGTNVIARGNADYGLLGINNKLILPFIYKRIDSIAVNRFAVQDQKSKISIVDQKGVSLLKSNIDSISAQLDQYYFIYRNGKAGLLTASGHVMYQPEYKNIRVTGNEVSVQSFNEWKLIGADNKIISTLNFDEVSIIGADLYVVSINGKQRILDTSGEEERFSPSFDRIRFIRNGLIQVENNGSQGIIDGLYETLIPASFDSLMIKEDLVYALKKGKWSLYDIHGTRKSVFEYQEMLPINEGRIAIRKNDKYGFINRRGEEVIYPVFDSASTFADGKSVVTFHGEFGIIDKNGDWIVYPQKGTSMSVLNEDLYLLKSEGTDQVKKMDGPVVYYTSNELSKEGEVLFEYTKDATWKVVSFNGVLIGGTSIVKPSFLGNTSIIIQKDSSSIQGVSQNGQILIPYQEYEDITSYSEGFMGILKDGFYGFVDNDNKLRIANRYEGIGPFSEGLAAFKLRGKWGFINMSERIVVQPYYSRVTDFKNGLSIISKGDLHGMVDKTGKIVLPVEFQAIRETEDGNFILVQDGKFGIANEAGVILIYPQYSKIEDTEGEGFVVTKNNYLGVINNYGESLIPFQYKSLHYENSAGLFIAKTDGEWSSSSLE